MEVEYSRDEELGEVLVLYPGDGRMGSHGEHPMDVAV